MSENQQAQETSNLQLHDRVFYPDESKYGSIRRLRVSMQGGTYDFGVVFDDAPALMCGFNRGELLPVEKQLIAGEVIGGYVLQGEHRLFLGSKYEGRRVRVSIECVKQQ